MTFDLDFADVRAYPPGTHAGIVVFRLPDQRWRTVEPELRRLLAAGTEQLAVGLTIVQPGRIRRRLRPAGPGSTRGS